MQVFVGIAPVEVDISSPGFLGCTPLLDLPPTAAAPYLGTYLLSLLQGLKFQEGCSQLADEFPQCFGVDRAAACQLQRSALDEEGSGGDNRYKANPDFVSLQDFHLRRTANSNACCIDQLDGAAAPRVDIDGTSRPQGVRFDIGAHEVK